MSIDRENTGDWLMLKGLSLEELQAALGPMLMQQVEVKVVPAAIDPEADIKAGFPAYPESGEAEITLGYATFQDFQGFAKVIGAEAALPTLWTSMLRGGHLKRFIENDRERDRPSFPDYLHMAELPGYQEIPADSEIVEINGRIFELFKATDEDGFYERYELNVDSLWRLFSLEKLPKSFHGIGIKRMALARRFAIHKYQLAEQARIAQQAAEAETEAFQPEYYG